MVYFSDYPLPIIGVWSDRKTWSTDLGAWGQAKCGEAVYSLDYPDQFRAVLESAGVVRVKLWTG